METENEQRPIKLPFWLLMKEFAGHFFGGLYTRADQHHIFLLSSGLAFSLFVCIVPLVLIIFSIVGNIVEKPSVVEDIELFIDRVIPYEDYATFVKEKVFARMEEFSLYKSIAGWIGFIGIFFAASGLFSAMRTTLNMVFRLRPSESVVMGKLRDFGLVLLVLIYFLISTAVLPALGLIGGYAKNYEFLNGALPGIVGQLAFWAVSFAIIFVAFSLIYWAIPQGRVPKRTVLVSALSAAILWELAKQLFGFYITHTITLKKVYGAYVFIVVVAFWVYYTGIVFILGAEIGQLISDWRRKLAIIRKKYA
jgi:membrane protein